MKWIFIFIAIFFNLFVSNFVVYSQPQLTESQIKASYIYNFAINTTWPNISKIDTFTIAILGQNDELFNNLNLVKKNKIIHDKPIEIIQSYDIDNIIKHNPQIVYISSVLNANLHNYYWKLSKYPILIVTDRAEKLIYTMINFYKRQERLYFVINEQNTKAAGLEVNRELLVLGGSQLDIYKIYKQMEEETHQLRKKLLHSQKLFDSLSVVIDSQLNTISAQQQIIHESQNKIKNLLEKLDAMRKDYTAEKEALDSLKHAIKEREIYLANRNTEITEKEQKIKQLKDNIATQRQIYNDLLRNIRIKKQQLNRKEQELNNYQKRFLAQRKSIYALSFLIISFIVTISFIYIMLKKNRQKNKQLEEANRLITSQAEELKVVNHELEKVSLAASKVDNVIYILTPYGTIEWVNDAVVTKYHFKKSEIIGKKLYKIISLSPEQIIKFLEKSRLEKKPIVFDNYFKKGDGSYIWVQTTFTPILNKEGQVERIIALDSDITKIKLATYEIEKKNEELLAQHEILTKQKEQIESQNNIISSSIDYALIIQRSIMPKQEVMKKYLNDYFLIFRPLQTVSGDFYWMSGENDDYNTFYASVIDCTGHGVPGAFMSLISERLLDEIIFMKDIKMPSNIISELDKMIIDILGTTDDNEDTLAGLDIILIKVQKQQGKYKITFAGAKRPMVYYVPGQEDIEFIKTDRFSVGQDLFKREKRKIFTDYTVEVPEGTVIYMYTDGVTDQYCSFLRKKIGTYRLLDIIREFKDLPLSKQNETLITYLDYCMKDEEQRDDITFWALKL